MCCDNASYLFFFIFFLNNQLVAYYLDYLYNYYTNSSTLPKSLSVQCSTGQSQQGIYQFTTVSHLLLSYFILHFDNSSSCSFIQFLKKLVQCSDHLKQSSDSVQSLSSPNSIFCKNAKIYPKTYRISRDLEQPK